MSSKKLSRGPDATRTANPATSPFRLAALGLLAPILLVPAGCQSHPSGDPNTPTNIAISGKVLRSNVKRFGINLSGQSFYDSGQMLRDLTMRNPGFEGEIWQTVLQCKFVRGDSCADNDEWSTWPVNFAKGGRFEFFYGAAKGEAGTVIASSAANTAPHQGVWINFGSLPVHPAVGDFYIVRMTIPGTAETGWRTALNGGATFTTEFHDLSPDSPGSQALSIHAAAPGQFASIISDVDTWIDHSFVQLKGDYTLSFRAKGLGGKNTLNVSLVRLTDKHGRAVYFNRELTLSSRWQNYSFPLKVHEDGSYIGPIELTFSVGGSNVLLDDASFTEAASPGNPTVFRDAVVDRLRDLKPGILRDMDNGTNFGSTIDNLLAPPYARQRSGFGEGPHAMAEIPIGLPDFLALCQAVHAEPWFVIPMGTSENETRNLLEYLAAPGAGPDAQPYGVKRAALGQSTPWTRIFPIIHLELGNETWNWNSFPGEGILDPKAYGARVSKIFATAKSSPFYDPHKFDLVMNGWWAVPAWTADELKMNPHADTIDIAPYTFNPFNDASSTEAIFGPMFAEPEAYTLPRTGLNARNEKLAAQFGVRLATYEVNLGTTRGNVTQADLESAVPSVGAGISVADNMLLMLRDCGIVDQSLFALPEYANPFTNLTGPNTHPIVKLWGAVVDMGGQTNRNRPTFLAEKLVNEALEGNMLETVQSGGNPTWDQPKSPNSEYAIDGAHLIQSFAFSDGKHSSLVVLNLSRTSNLSITFSGSMAPHGEIQVSRLTAPRITDNNEILNNVKIARNTLPTFDPAKPYPLPPFSITLLSWSNSSVTSSP